MVDCTLIAFSWLARNRKLQSNRVIVICVFFLRSWVYACVLQSSLSFNRFHMKIVHFWKSKLWNRFPERIDFVRLRMQLQLQFLFRVYVFHSTLPCKSFQGKGIVDLRFSRQPKHNTPEQQQSEKTRRSNNNEEKKIEWKKHKRQQRRRRR